MAAGEIDSRPGNQRDQPRECIETYKHLSQRYAAVRNACAPKVGLVGDLAYRTQRLIEANATQQGLGAYTKSVTFEVKTLESPRGDQRSGQGKVF